MMGDVFCRQLLVVQLPREFSLGLLSLYASNPNVKVSIVTHPIQQDVSKHLKKEYHEMESEYKKTNDPSMKQKLETRLNSLDTYIQETIRNHDKTHNYLMVYTVTADSLEDLDDRTMHFKAQLQNDGFMVETLGAMKIDILKASTPLWIENNIQKDILYNIGVPLSSGSIAGMWPYIFETLKDPKGFLFGRELNNGGVIVWDPMFYENNPEERKQYNRLTGNFVVVGGTGSGKTTDMNLIVRYIIREKMFLCWIDPENKNQFITESYGGTFINWGTKNSQINIFDLKPISSDEEDDKVNPWDTELAIYNVVDEFKNVLKLYKPNITEDTLSMVGELVIEMYQKHGINFDTEFRYKPLNEYPVLSDFNELLLNKIELYKLDPSHMIELQLLQDLAIKIKPMMIEHKYYFDGHTTIDFSNSERKILSFGTKNLIDKDRNLKESLNYIMFRYAWSLCLDEEHQSAFIIDEAHEFILEGQSAKEIALFYRRSRKYHNMMGLGTQETRDFASQSVIIHGKAIFNNSTYKIIKKLNKDAVEYLQELMNINETEVQLIQQFEQGDALFTLGDRRIPISVIATEKELDEIDPKRRL